MQRALNYTGRQRILARDMDCRVTQVPGEVPIARIVITLSDYEIPAGARVFVEAYRRTEFQRFDIGIVRDVATKHELRLSSFESIDGIQFRIKVVEASDSGKRLAAEADRIQPVDDSKIENKVVSLLPIIEAPLDGEVWRLEFRDRPTLLLEKRWYAQRVGLLMSPTFFPVVMPVILRSILFRILTGEGAGIRTGHVDVDDMDDWRSRWMAFATSLVAERHPPSLETADVDDIDGWIDDVVTAFARRHRLDAHFGQTISGDDE